MSRRSLEKLPSRGKRYPNTKRSKIYSNTKRGEGYSNTTPQEATITPPLNNDAHTHPLNDDDHTPPLNDDDHTHPLNDDDHTHPLNDDDQPLGSTRNNKRHVGHTKKPLDARVVKKYGIKRAELACFVESNRQEALDLFNAPLFQQDAVSLVYLGLVGLELHNHSSKNECIDNKFGYLTRAAYYFSLSQDNSLLTYAVNIMGNKYRKLLHQYIEDTASNHISPQYRGEAYSVLSDHEEDNTMRYHYYQQGAWNYALVNELSAVTRLADMMSRCDFDAMRVEGEDLKRLRENPLYGAQLFEALATTSVGLIIEQSGLMRALNEKGINIPLRQIILSGIISCDGGVTTLKEGKYKLDNHQLDLEVIVNPNTSITHNQMLKLTINGRNATDLIQNQYFEHDVSDWFYNAANLSCQGGQIATCLSYMNAFISLNFKRASALNDSPYKREDNLLLNLLKYSLVRDLSSDENEMKGTVAEYTLGELGSLARCAVAKNLLHPFRLINQMTEKSLAFAEQQASQYKEQLPLYGAHIYQALFLNGFKKGFDKGSLEDKEILRYQQLTGYYYSLINDNNTRVRFIYNFVKCHYELAKTSANTPELQNSAPLYTAEIFNQLWKTKGERSAGTREKINYLENAIRLYNIAGKHYGANHLSKYLSNILKEKNHNQPNSQNPSSSNQAPPASASGHSAFFRSTIDSTTNYYPYDSRYHQPNSQNPSFSNQAPPASASGHGEFFRNTPTYNSTAHRPAKYLGGPNGNTNYYSSSSTDTKSENEACSP